MTTNDDQATGAPVPPSNKVPLTKLEEGLAAAGWDAPSVAVWISAAPDPDHSPEQHLHHVLAWGRAFPDAATARKWFDSALQLEDAAAWYRAGFSLPDAEGIQWRIIMAALNPDVTAMVQAEDSWRASGLPAAWICACLDLGVVDVAAARRLFDLRESL